MNSPESLEAQRQELIQQMSAITRMRRGTVNEQYFENRQQDGSVIQRGPYLLYSRTEKGKSFSQRISVAEREEYQQDTENCRRFKELSNSYVLVCEQLALLGSEDPKKKRSPRKRSATTK